VRILIDESLPRGLKTFLAGLDVLTVPEEGLISAKPVTRRERRDYEEAE
jgi:hypothetical protein